VYNVGKKEEIMDWMKKHVDTVVILGAFGASLLWMNGKFNSVEQRLKTIEVVLIMKDIMPKELCKTHQE